MRHIRRLIILGCVFTLLWMAASVVEWSTGHRVLPWSAYGNCGYSKPTDLPKTIQVGLYEEFPNPWRLKQLNYITFPVTLAVAAPSRAEFLALRSTILREYPHVREVYFWPVLSHDEGYYPGTWSDSAAVQRVANDAADLPVLWDMEMPLQQLPSSARSWRDNKEFLNHWLLARTKPVHIWRTHTTMGLDPLFLRLAGMHFDPLDYPEVSLHLDLYMKDTDPTDEQMAHILRCGVERYGSRFVPSFGVLDDGYGSGFVSPVILQRNLTLARDAGVSQIWLFGVNGLNESVVTMLKESIPLEE
ncbi:MAG: hypothetical protein RI947_240 [Candidatus Parcubacteria bacterium]